MTQKRIAIIDDDPFLVAHLQQAIAERLTGVEVVGIEDPVAPAGFDAYVVDREFGGDSLGHDVIGRVRALEPNSLVLAYSNDGTANTPLAAGPPPRPPGDDRAARARPALYPGRGGHLCARRDGARPLC